MEQFLKKEDFDKIHNIIKKLNKENIFDLKIKNLEIAKFASYEIISKFKKNKKKLKDNEFEYFLKNVENCLKVYFSLDNFNKEFKTDIAIAYNGSYGVCNTFLDYFRDKNISSYLLHGSSNNIDRNVKINFYKDGNIQTMQKIKNSWNQFENIPLKENEINSVNKHLNTIMYANVSHTFSPSIKKNWVDIKKFFNIENDKKIHISCNEQL